MVAYGTYEGVWGPLPAQDVAPKADPPWAEVRFWLRRQGHLARLGDMHTIAGAFVQNKRRTRPMRHILESQQFDRRFLEYLYAEADRCRRVAEGRGSESWRIHYAQKFPNGSVHNYFSEESFRTRISFEVAARALGMGVVTTTGARKFSSEAKGESLEHTIRVMCGYLPDVIVLRYHEEGGAKRAAAVSSVPIINAGDGSGQHPTQALTDLYTILRVRGAIDGATVLVGGDLAYGRVVRSLVYLLAKFERIRIIFVAPPEVAVKDDIKDYLDRHDVQFEETENLQGALPEADIVYWTRLQKERMPKGLYPQVVGRYVITPREVSLMRPEARLLHPLPIDGEILPEVDLLPPASYFTQAHLGLFVRMALYQWILADSPRFR